MVNSGGVSCKQKDPGLYTTSQSSFVAPSVVRLREHRMMRGQPANFTGPVVIAEVVKGNSG